MHACACVCMFVCVCVCVFVCVYMRVYVCVYVCMYLQTDLIALPPIIANRVLKRQPLNILYVKKHLLSRHQSSTSIPPPLSHTYNASVQCTQRSGHHLEEPLSIKAFTNQQTESMRRGEESCLSPSPSDTNSAQHSHTLGKREEHNDTPELSESS